VRNKKSEPKRTGANAQRKREVHVTKIRTTVPHVKPGRLLLLLVVLGFAGYKVVEFAKSGKIGAMVAPMVASNGIVLKGVATIDTSVISSVLSDTGLTISPRSQKRVLNLVRELPGVASAQLGFSLSKQIVITIKERVPVAYVVFKGNLYFMSQDGFIWSFKPGSYWDFPVLSGVTCSVSKSGVRRVVEKDMNRYESILKTFENQKGIRPVGFDLSNPDRLSVRFNGIAPTIRFGNDPEKRLENMNGILEIVRRDDVDVRHYIDLSYKNVAFIR